MKIIQINNVYGIGSTGKITQSLHRDLLEHGVQSSVLFGRGPSIVTPHVSRVCTNLYGKYNGLLSRITGNPYGGCHISTMTIIRRIKKAKPDLVHLQCLNGYFVNITHLLSWLGKQRIPTVLTLHAEFMYTGNCSHAMNCERWQECCGHCPRLYAATKSLFWDRTHNNFIRMEQAFAAFEDTLYVVSVSPWLMERAGRSPILQPSYQAGHHLVIYNGVETQIFRVRDTKDLFESYRMTGKKIIFHATAMFRDRDNDPKGGYAVLELARRMQEQPVIFLVAGKYEINDDIPPNVVLLGEITDQDLLARYYNLADLTLLTSERETFSMVVAESLCCGTPVVGFMAGAPETIALQAYSSFVPFGDIAALEASVLTWLNFKDHHSAKLIASAAKVAYGKDKMTQSYRELYRRVICSK